MPDNSESSHGAPAIAFAPRIDFGHTGCAEMLRVSEFDEFITDENLTNVTVFEVACDGLPTPGDTVRKQVFRKTKDLVQHCRAATAPQLRIISIPQEDSYSELEVTKGCMESIIEIHSILPDFLTILYAAGVPPRDSEEGFGHPIENWYEDGSFSIAYLSRYYEQREKSWKLRQTGVYHAYSEHSKSNIIILLQPRENSKFQVLFEKAVSEPGSALSLVGQPTRVHALLFTSYFDNWRWFLREKGDSFIKGAEKLFVARVDDEEYLDISFNKLQSWRDLEDRIMPLASIFQALSDLLDVLEVIDNKFCANLNGNQLPLQTNFFRSRKGAVKALMTSARGLQHRIHGVLSLLADTLEMRNHNQLARTNEHLLNLQRENVEDSQTVQIITVVTLMYLPASFVATLFGMNLFVFNTTTSHIRIAKDFWLYIAIMIPLTFITVFYWYIKTKKSRAERHRRFQSPNATAVFSAPKDWHNMQEFVHNSRQMANTGKRRVNTMF